MHGVKIPIDADFNLEGVGVFLPADPRVNLRLTANCMCYVNYERQEEEVFQEPFIIHEDTPPIENEQECNELKRDFYYKSKDLNDTRNYMIQIGLDLKIESEKCSINFRNLVRKLEEYLLIVAEDSIEADPRDIINKPKPNVGGWLKLIQRFTFIITPILLILDGIKAHNECSHLGNILVEKLKREINKISDLNKDLLGIAKKLKSLGCEISEEDVVIE